MGRRVIWIPADLLKDIEVIDLPDVSAAPWSADPYQLGQHLHKSHGNEPNDTVWQEKVKTSYTDTCMMVDESGLLKQLPQNVRANTFYPFGVIAGDALICHYKIEWDEEGPAEMVDDLPDSMLDKLTEFMLFVGMKFKGRV